MEKYALYAAKNILQFRKNQDDIKLNRGLQEAIKKYIIEKSFSNNDDVVIKDEEEWLNKNDKKD